MEITKQKSVLNKGIKASRQAADMSLKISIGLKS